MQRAEKNSSEILRVHLSRSTRALRSPDDVVADIRCFIDLTALALVVIDRSIILYPDSAVIPPRRVESLELGRREVPLSSLVKTYRREQLLVASLQYSNPLEIGALAAAAAGQAGKAAGAIERIATLGSSRRKAAAEADSAVRQNILDEALFDLTLEEAIAIKETAITNDARAQVALKQSEQELQRSAVALEKEKLELERQRLELRLFRLRVASEMVELGRKASRRMTEGQADQIADNVRLLDSISRTEPYFSVDVRVEE